MKASAERLTRLVLHSAAHGRSELHRIDYLDGWRGLAIAAVLQAHFVAMPNIDFGRLGVDIFFVLSGLLMSGILFVKRVPLKVFYQRRISRIVPAFLLFVVTVYGAGYLTGAPEWRNFPYTVLFLRIYVPGSPDIWQTGLPIGHLWSLCVEEHCYIFLSTVTLMAFLRGREGFVLLGAGIASIAVRLAYIRSYPIVPDTYDLRTEAAASHLLISAGYFLLAAHARPFVRPWMPIVAFALAVLCYTNFLPWWTRILLSPFLLALAVNHLSAVPHVILSILSTSFLRLLGIWSYSIYLWQQPFYAYSDHNDQTTMTVALVLAVSVGVISFYCLENPVRTWLNRRWQ